MGANFVIGAAQKLKGGITSRAKTRGGATLNRLRSQAWELAKAPVTKSRTVQRAAKRVVQRKPHDWQDALQNASRWKRFGMRAGRIVLPYRTREKLAARVLGQEESTLQSVENFKEEANKFLARFKTPEEAEKVIDPQSLISYTKEKLENQKTLKFLEELAEIE